MRSNHNLVISASAAAILTGAIMLCVCYVYRRKKSRHRHDYRSGTFADSILIVRPVTIADELIDY